jgi:starch-binding outer membrane protein, SusD/RagB family
MKKNTRYTIFLMAALALCLLSLSGCKKLDEQTYDAETSDNFYKNADQVLSAYLMPYSFLQTHIYQVHFALQEFTTDEAVAPTRGGYVDQNGAWIRFHQHTWTSSEPWIELEWSNLFQAIGLCNNFIDAIQNRDLSSMTNLKVSKEQMIAEVKMVRALHYYWALSDFGNIPIVERIGEQNPPTKTSAEVFAFIEKEIKDNIPLLIEKGDENWYGRFTKSAAHALLAKLYLNAEALTGTPRWDDCIAECDEVISSGKYSLDPTWDAPFLVQNENSNENIFVVPFDASQAPQFNAVQQQLHWDMSGKYNLNFADGCWFKTVTDESFYNKFKSNDKRINQWLVGPQMYIDENGDEQPVLNDDGEPLVITPKIEKLFNTDGGWYDGAINIKYQVEEGGLDNMNNDLVVFRLADVMFMKAESLMRKNNNTATTEAVNLINAVRKRSFAANDNDAEYTTTTLTMDELLDERAREFAYEMWRREDLIRFGKFDDAWWEKEASDAHYNLFPIPSNILTSNLALQQNAGY